MSDDKNKRGPADRNRISLHEDYEAFGVTKEQLSAAVKTVGNSADKVREHLKKR